jgi:cytochrome c-type biogenesis protein CcmE
MTRKQQRLGLLALGMAALGGATALVLVAFSDNLVFFYSPSELRAKAVAPDRRLRIGGLVETHSLVRGPDGRQFSFRVTDGASNLAVVYEGLLPDLFREGQGVVAEGKLGPDGVFAATTVLAKHDENYMPREVVDALKQSGHWQEGGATKAAAGPSAPTLPSPAPSSVTPAQAGVQGSAKQASPGFPLSRE